MQKLGGIALSERFPSYDYSAERKTIAALDALALNAQRNGATGFHLFRPKTLRLVGRLTMHHDPVTRYLAASLLAHHGPLTDKVESVVKRTIGSRRAIAPSVFLPFITSQFDNWQWRNEQIGIRSGSRHSAVSHPDAGYSFSRIHDQAKLRTILSNALVLARTFAQIESASNGALDRMRTAGEALLAGTLKYDPRSGVVEDPALRRDQAQMSRVHHEQWLQERRRRQAQGWVDAGGAHQGEAAFEALPADEVRRMNFQTLANWRTLGEMAPGALSKLIK